MSISMSRDLRRDMAIANPWFIMKVHWEYIVQFWGVEIHATEVGTIPVCKAGRLDIKLPA